MRRTCNYFWTASALLFAIALLPACSPSDLVQNMQQDQQPSDDATPADESADGIAGGDEVADEQDADADPQDEPNREVATAGVGKKGRLKGEGLLRSPIKQYFRAPQVIIFDIQIPTMIKQHKALHGKGPQSHEEFMKEIIEAGRIELPQLPEGDRYEYDPEEEQLYVIHPK